FPRSDPLARSARIMSPVEICGTPSVSTRSLAWVPLPAPGGPKRITSISAPPTPDPRSARTGETLVVARDEVRLDLLDRVERDADHDHDRGAAEVERHAEERLERVRDHAHRCDVRGPAHRDASHHAVDVVGRLLAR